MNSETCLIIGAGQAASQLAFSLRKEGWLGSITLLGAEAEAPYQKPVLSKEFLFSEKTADDIAIKSTGAYEKKAIHVHRHATVTKIDRATKQVTLSDGQQLHYDKLAICTGATPRHLTIAGYNKANIFYLNSFIDAQSLRSTIAVQQPKKAVIVGGGFIGLEIASSLRKLGIDVTLIETESRILARVSAPEISAYFTSLHQQAGVNIVLNTKVTAFKGGDTVSGVECDNGTHFDADLVLVGIGVTPNSMLAEDAKLDVNNGIVVDARGLTSDPDIVAAGDCTVQYHPQSGRHLRIESIQNAVFQAKKAAATLCQKTIPNEETPWFWSDQYQTKLQIAGLSLQYTHTIKRGTNDKFSLWYFDGEKLQAVDCINNPKDFLFAKKALTKHLPLDQNKLKAQDTPLEEACLTELEPL
ncbi:FAD-dependent oxidoreductase [Pseudoalteromonas xiamenensis]|uniref:NAD(P)/FAD-dependent oxidoreductase n=1 Tax=Pseudoalteromonas xiamenensis TaxID=882626 RepID=UPI0027E3E3E3|nr:FAD-dependent oxidoreductase [Pseudoalteromonas xiamenensis]WMN61381.1 FAD-dependent oxidoreductase [Pseudoalteromonas xiamenensis]